MVTFLVLGLLFFRFDRGLVWVNVDGFAVVEMRCAEKPDGSSGVGKAAKMMDSDRLRRSAAL